MAGPQNGRPGAGATGVFPAGYAAPPDQLPPAGYSPHPGQGRGRPPATPVKPRRLIDYPRWGRKGFTRWLPSWKLIAGLFATGVLMVMAGLFAAYSAISLPPPDASAAAQTSIIYFKDGKTPIGQLATQNRQSVKLSQVPKHVQDAVLAAEDRTFRTNSGVDPTSIARAVWSNVRGNSLQGGSTISQQYVKTVYDQRDRSIKRKAKEVFLAVKVNRQLDKNQILEQYLNTIYLGRGAYGIQAASHAYFGQSTDVSELTVAQGAFLAGIINAPSLADPRGGADEKARAVRRWGVVLDAMVTEKWLDPTERAKMKFPTTVKPASSVTLKGQNGYLKDMVVQEAAVLGWSEDELMKGGYKITTTFDQKLVTAGAKAVKDMLPKDKPKGLNIGMASIDPSTGAVRAIYGGPGGLNYKGADNNNATIASAQAGSTFKAFGLIAALESGVSLKTEYNSDSPVTVDGHAFRNSEDGESSGFQDLVVGTKKSLNTIYAQLNSDVGPPKTAKAAYAAGIPEKVKIDGNLANVLGSADPHAIDMASAYGTFAAQGVHRDPYTIESIAEIGTKKSLWSKTKQGALTLKGKRVFKPDSTADLTYALQSVVQNGGTGTYAQRLNRPVAGKTGTSTGPKSAWFVGYTPQLSTSVMMYQLGNVKYKGQIVKANVKMEGFGEFRDIFGGGYPIRIWTEYMEAALKGVPVKDFPPPAYAGEITNRAPVVITTTQPPPPTEAPPTEAAPPPPDPTETSDQPDPTDTEPEPSATRPIFPTVDPTDPDGNGNGGGGGGNDDDDR